MATSGFHHFPEYYRTYWIIVASSVLALALRRVALYVSDRCCGIRRSMTADSASASQPANQHLGCTLIFSIQAFQTKFLDRPAVFRVASFNLFGSLSYLQLFIVATFFIVNLMLVLAPLINKPADAGKVWMLDTMALHAGHATMINLPLLFATAGRRNVFSCITGIPYRTLNFAHRAVGRLCFFMVVLHASLALILLRTTAGPQGLKANYHLPYFQAGLTGLFCLVISVTMSLLIVRSRKFDWFLLTHVGAAITLLISIYHHQPGTIYWVAGAAAIWSFDRLSRWLSVIYIHFLAPLWTRPGSSRKFGLTTATVDHLDGALVLRVPMRSTWESGQHIYLNFWSRKMLLKPWLFGRWHPFALTNLPNDAELQRKDQTELGSDNDPWMACCVVQVRKGTTKWLEQHAGSSIQVLIQGPFGGHIYAHEAYSSLILIAGGAGITHVLSILEGVAMSARQGKSGNLVRVEIYWMLRNQAHLAWVEHRVNQVCAVLGDLSLDISAYAYITTVIPLSASAPIASESQPGRPPQQHRRGFGIFGFLPRERPNIPVQTVSRPTLLSTAPKVSDHQYIKMIRNPLYGLPDEMLHPAYSLGDKFSTKFGSLPGLLVDKSVFTVRSGRPNLDVVLSEACERSPGRVLMHVCGPRPLSDAVKLSASKLASPLATWRGQKNKCIVVHQELFNAT